MVLPFTTPSGHVHLLRHLNPEIVYLQESLAGPNGDIITHLQSWLRQDVILVVGAEGGGGGLADSESEAEAAPKKENQWWRSEDRVGLGRGAVVLESLRIGDDWARCPSFGELFLRSTLGLMRGFLYLIRQLFFPSGVIVRVTRIFWFCVRLFVSHFSSD
jgi:hypothetical protein